MDRVLLQRYLDELLDAARFKDYCPNGLQVEGAPEVGKVLCGVTASMALIEAAIARFPVVETVMMRRNVYKEMDEKGLLHAVALQKQADPNPLMRPHVRNVVEALEEATDILNNILAA